MYEINITSGAHMMRHTFEGREKAQNFFKAMCAECAKGEKIRFIEWNNNNIASITVFEG